jgi:poly(3-hydroxybutyrate) depolymerase
MSVILACIFSLNCSSVNIPLDISKPTGMNCSSGFEHEGVKRNYTLHLPPGHSSTWPLVINMHAAGSTEKAQQSLTRFNSLNVRVCGLDFDSIIEVGGI